MLLKTPPTEPPGEIVDSAELSNSGAAAVTTQEAGQPVSARTSVLLFDTQTEAHAAHGLHDLGSLNPTDGQLLWVDVLNPQEPELRELARTLSLPDEAIAAILGNDTSPLLKSCGECFWLRVVAVAEHDGIRFQGRCLTLIAGKNLVVSVHREPIDFIEQKLQHQSGQGGQGSLGSASFTAALLDWQLSTYFDAVAQFEMEVERLEVDVLAEKPRDCLQDLRALRKGASRLRRMLAPHRVVFSGMARPDFRPQEELKTDGHFQALDTHFERAMDMVENARDLVVGSFELFSTQTALRTNDTVRVLTFVTVVVGLLAVLAGVLGMNFETPFFKSGTIGFVVAISAMLALAGLAVLVGKKRDWL
ncbi:MAG: CorA family divalent cation transporter [Pseudoxanthomonas sp.]